MTKEPAIRVSREMQDVLATVAENHGSTVADLIVEFASPERLRQIYADERRAFTADLENPEFIAELDLWDSAELDELI